jgi:membrane protease YdiL (CAAX protease family)
MTAVRTQSITAANPSTTPAAAKYSVAPWLMLLSRSMLFVVFQLLMAGVLYLAGNAHAWGESARWWLFSVIPTNIVSVLLLIWLFRIEGRHYLDILRFSKSTVRSDLLWLFGSSIIGIPLMMAPMNTLATLIFGNSMTPVEMMFRPLPGWALAAGVLFPLTIAFAELPVYFGYVMPRLASQLKNGWVAWLVAALFLAAQHCFLPLILDGRFILWRLGMYLPFALFIGLLIKFRPSLLPYTVIIHTLIDFSTLSVYWMV